MKRTFGRESRSHADTVDWRPTVSTQGKEGSRPSTSFQPNSIEKAEWQSLITCVICGKPFPLYPQGNKKSIVQHTLEHKENR